jgi:hypothetical protein
MANLFKAIWRKLGWRPPRGEDAAVVQTLAQCLLEGYQSSPLSDYFTVSVTPCAMGGHSRIFWHTAKGERLLRLYQGQKHKEAAISLLLPDWGGWEYASRNLLSKSQALC